MAKLDLRIVVDGNNQTRTLIGKKSTDDIVFHNASNAVLQVDFVPKNVIKDKRGTIVKGITVQAKGSETVTFDAAVGTQVKYTATIAGATPEDPIIIIV
jgi:hypothetical protein